MNINDKVAFKFLGACCMQDHINKGIKEICEYMD